MGEFVPGWVWWGLVAIYCKSSLVTHPPVYAHYHKLLPMVHSFPSGNSLKRWFRTLQKDYILHWGWFLLHGPRPPPGQTRSWRLRLSHYRHCKVTWTKSVLFFSQRSSMIQCAYPWTPPKYAIVWSSVRHPFQREIDNLTICACAYLHTARLAEKNTWPLVQAIFFYLYELL